MTANITSRLASAFAAGKREAFEEAAKRCDIASNEQSVDARNLFCKPGEAIHAYCSERFDTMADTFRTLSSAPPPATAQPRSEEVGDDAYPDITDEQFAAIKQSVIDLNMEHQRKIIDGLEQAIAVARGLRKPARSTTYTTPSPKPEDALREALDQMRRDGWMVAVHNDYRVGGEFFTFWLFTKGERCVKGEGRSDIEALSVARAALAKEGK